MSETSVLLTALSETQRAQALERFAIIRPALEDGITVVTKEVVETARKNLIIGPD